ncbi:hypothetical protein T31B1_19377 [Salinisphaera sp. T31B1]
MTNAVGQVHGSIAPTRTSYFGEVTTRRQVTEGFLVDQEEFEWFTEFDNEARTGHLVTEIHHGGSRIGQYNHATKALSLSANEGFLGCVSECDAASRDQQKALNAYENAEMEKKNTELTSWLTYPVTPIAAFVCLLLVIVPLENVFDLSDALAGGLLIALALLITLGVWSRTYRKRRSEKKVLAREFTFETLWPLQDAVRDARSNVERRYYNSFREAVLERVETHYASTGL